MVSVHLSTSQTLMRYISEWDPREAAHTKGGYLEGSISLPPFQGILRLEIQTWPAADVDPEVAEIHPILLHVVRIGKGKRDQDLEPVPNSSHWRQIFEVSSETRNVSVINSMSDLDIRPDGTVRNVPAQDVITVMDSDNCIALGKKRGQLNLVLLQPKQRTRSQEGEATITAVLQDRLQGATEKEVLPLEKFFKGKKARNLKKVRIRVEVFSASGNISAVSSQTIVDSGNKDIGAMDFVDAGPLASCEKGDRMVVMASEYILSRDVTPIFQIFSRDANNELVNHPELEELLQQPENALVNNTTILFTTPAQPRLQELPPSIEIKLTVKRLIDNYICNKKFDFQYRVCEFGNCIYCDFGIDKPELPY